MSSGPIKAEDISDNLLDKLSLLVFRCDMDKDSIAEILNAAIELEIASPPIYVETDFWGKFEKFVTEDRDDFSGLVEMGCIKHWKGEMV